MVTLASVNAAGAGVLTLSCCREPTATWRRIRGQAWVPAAPGNGTGITAPVADGVTPPAVPRTSLWRQIEMADSCLPESSRGPLHRNSRDVLYGLDQSEDSPDLELVTFDFPGIGGWLVRAFQLVGHYVVRLWECFVQFLLLIGGWLVRTIQLVGYYIVWPAVSAWTAAKCRVEPPMPAGFTIQVQGQVLTEGKEPKPVFNVLVLHRRSGVSGRTDPTGYFP